MSVVPGEDIVITNITVTNYRSLADVTVEFDLLTIIAGPNGAGKSNLVDVLRFVRDALQYGLDAAIVNRSKMSALRRWSAKGRPFDVEIQLTIRTEDRIGAYGFVLGSERRGEYRVKREFLAPMLGPETFAGFETRDGHWANPPSGIAPAVQPTTLTLPLLAALEPYKAIYDQLTGMGFYNILPSQLREPQKFSNPYPLDENGGNFATMLRALKQDAPGAAVELERAIRTVTGDIEGYDVRPVGSYLTARLRHVATSESIAPWFELWQESDGTLRMLGILSALHQHPPRTLIALEEPELAIHPGALALLWEEIVLASRHTQIVITTHSPDLLDMCSAQQLRIMEKVEGVSFIGRVSEEQTRMIQKRLVAPGQLLRAQGLERAQGN
jgi:predicted ATPase